MIADLARGLQMRFDVRGAVRHRWEPEAKPFQSLIASFPSRIPVMSAHAQRSSLRVLSSVAMNCLASLAVVFSIADVRAQTNVTHRNDAGTSLWDNASALPWSYATGSNEGRPDIRGRNSVLIGHEKVAAQHYLMSREHHFEHVVNGGAATSGANTETPAQVPPPCDAYCAAPATHLATQQASARDSAPSHETTEPAAATRVTAGSSEVTPFTRNGEMAGTGFEPVTSRL
jgi:hypothetical protein